MDSYNQFAFIYDKLMTADISYKKWHDYIEMIFSKYNKSINTILEMACGTGNLTSYLAKEDYMITCFDISQEMLSIAQDKLKNNRNVKLYKRDMVDFSFNKKYDSILCMCDSINYITDKEELLAVFKNVYKHLNDDGIFIFDINSYYKLNNIIGNNTFVHDDDNVFYVWENIYDAEKEICQFYLTFFVKEGDTYKRFDEEHLERAYKLEEIIELLNRAGFKDIDAYHEFTFEEVMDKSERINFVVKK
ncbi:class I SAM-dependent DNA methyltransferase [Dethiothermospora halolimnae]|uniref:class I SAM-dependent DNA methyltransferase n=1 Tax=Dethiothermospora halolimnae TaxID=3114390 RepID=UPI003CCB8C69